jgi:hypothetical protein
MNQIARIAGIAVILLIAVLFSSNRKAIRLRVVGAAFALQAVIALLVLGPAGAGRDPGAVERRRQPARLCQPRAPNSCSGRARSNPLAHTFAIAALPVIIFFASLVAILYYLGIMQRIVRWVGGAIGWVTGISRVESLGAGGQHLRRPVGIAAGRPALSRRAAALAAVHVMTSAWPASPAPSSPLMRACSAKISALSCSPRPSCRRRAGS